LAKRCELLHHTQHAATLQLQLTQLSWNRSRINSQEAKHTFDAQYCSFIKYK